MKNIIVLLLFVSGIARANVVGTEYQNFNPDISGTDFVTVHSSEPVKPCFCNFGVFFNWAKNTLTYSDRYYATNQDLKGVRANDSLVGADVYGAFGLSKNWDFGVALPFVVTAKNDDPFGVSYFENFGLTEIRPVTKYRFYGDDEGGMAVLLSANFNMIKDNPFAGQNPGPTVNLEFAADTTTDGGWKLGGNLGFRKRNSGAQVIDPKTNLLVPFKPFTDSVIYSAAVAKYFNGIKSSLVAELNGSSPSGSGDDSTKTAQTALELGLGIRHESSKTLNLHAGLGAKVADAQATPDIRAYAGLNFVVGPVCSTSKAAKIIYPAALVKNLPKNPSATTKLNMPVTALEPADYEAYRYKIGATPEMDCYKEDGYSGEIEGSRPIITDIGPIPDGGITLCALAKNKGDIWQPLAEPTIVNWVKGSSPVAVVKDHPVGNSPATDLNMPVSALSPDDYEAYRWKIGSTPAMDCYKDDGYSAEIEGTRPIITDIGPIPDGGITLCALAKNKGQTWQPLSKPTIINWIKGKSPVAVVQNHPVGVSDAIDLKMPVTAVNPNDYAAYRWKIGATPDMDCQIETDYSAELPGQTPIVTSIGPIPDGGITLCSVAKNLGGVWQPFSAPTITQWEKKRGYELFRLNANVLFDFDKDVLQQRSFWELEKINRHVTKKPYAKVIIEGHTDAKGTNEYNMDLGQRRANRVKAYMIDKYKWEAGKISSLSMGEKIPVDTNETDDGRANNRRVEFKVYRK